MTPGYALQTCKRSVVHDGFEIRQVTFHKLTTDSLGLMLDRRSLDQHAYYQANSATFLSVWCLGLLSDYPRDAVLAQALAMALCLCPSASVCHKSEFYRNG